MTAVTTKPLSGVAIVRRPTRVRLAWLALAFGVLVVLILLSISVGARGVSLEDMIAGLQGQADNLGQAAVLKRVPRTLLALIVGAALAVSGTMMQGVTRNPLADPGILGVNAGASLAVVVGIAFFGLWTASGFIWIAIMGATVAAIFVYLVGALGRGGATPLKLALAGAATAVALGAFVSAIVLPRNDIAGSVRSWQVGGVGGASFDTIGAVLPFLTVGLIVSWLSARRLNNLALGDDVATGLGERVAVARASAAVGAVLLCGAATAVAGPIAFVGLVVPHVCRLLVGVDHRWLVPFGAVVGAALVIAADVVGRVIARPGEIEVGIITALIGAPVFIHIVRRQKVREL
ncbi:FecCD family ABC transporter permease [Demequina aurantiaca]|uniref:FecCD family ABC transporter permease n=1 Tax=Demequina aurantiaca TaxID=676200 RepID=UPI003D33D4ED